MARRPKGRALNGLLILNKPQGITSNTALQIVKRLYYAQKAGHTGSLDPLATGVLPICFGEATKFSQFLLDSDKGYASTFVLGVETDTGDADGEIINNLDASAITEADVSAALVQFTGAISQMPPMYSALKHNGQPLYKLARQGIEVERKTRDVFIYELSLVAFRAGEHPEVDVVVHCSKGTYIRTIAEDLGKALGCGAHVASLHRLKAGPFDDAGSVSLKTLEVLKDNDALIEMDALLKPVDAALGHLPSVTLCESAGFYLRRGQAVLVPQAPTGGTVKLSMEDGEFVGVGEIMDDGRVTPRRLVASAASS